jgi:hypothetical protein
VATHEFTYPSGCTHPCPTPLHWSRASVRVQTPARVQIDDHDKIVISRKGRRRPKDADPVVRISVTVGLYILMAQCTHRIFTVPLANLNHINQSLCLLVSTLPPPSYSQLFTLIFNHLLADVIQTTSLAEFDILRAITCKLFLTDPCPLFTLDSRAQWSLKRAVYMGPVASFLSPVISPLPCRFFPLSRFSVQVVFAWNSASLSRSQQSSPSKRTR